MTKSRLEAFSDGVLAIAITLLVIDLRPPQLEPGKRLAHALWQHWPSYVAYLVSFLTIGVLWLNHHWILEQVVQVDGPLLVLNLNVLLRTALLPFPTAVWPSTWGGGEAARTAAALYSGVLMLLALAGCPVRLGHPRRPVASAAACDGGSHPDAVPGRPGHPWGRVRAVMGVTPARLGRMRGDGAQPRPPPPAPSTRRRRWLNRIASAAAVATWCHDPAALPRIQRAWCCWPVRSSASKRSRSHLGDGWGRLTRGTASAGAA